MKFNAFTTPQSMGRELGERLKRARLNLDLTQEEVALSAGVSRYTVKTLEHGDGKILDLMAVLIALKITDQLDNLLAPQVISPIQLFKLQGKIRKRASGTNCDTVASRRNEIEEDIGW
jgi:transcriptional regulator with XRE-family HTH domain